MFRWGILSTAKIAAATVIPAIQQSSNGNVHAIASRDKARAEALAQQCGAPKFYGSYQQLLDDPEIDGVYIPLPTSQHIQWSIASAKAGKHLLCEKPMAMKADEIDELIKLRNEKGLVISEAYMVYYHPQWQKTTELIAEGAIGKLRQVEGVFTYHNIDPQNIRNQLESGGGGLRDIGVYPMVTTRMVTGKEPQSFSAMIDYDSKFGTDRYANVTADFGEFALNFYVSTQMAMRQNMIFHGDKGYIHLKAPFNAGHYGHSEICIYNQRHENQQTWRWSDNQYQIQVEEFVRATQGKGEVFSLENSRLNQTAIDKIFIAGSNNS